MSVCNSSIASAVWSCTELDLTQLCLPGHTVIAKHLPHIYKPLPDKREVISLHESANHFTNLSDCSGTDFKAKLWSTTAFSWERTPVLLAVRSAADGVACSTLDRPLRWRWRVWLDTSPVKVHEDYRAEHIKRGHTNSSSHHPGSRLTASGRESERQHKQISLLH